jgi:hypothetical protein
MKTVSITTARFAVLAFGLTLAGCTVGESEPADTVDEGDAFASSSTCMTSTGNCYFCPRQITPLSADLKMIMSVAGWPRSRVVEECKAKGIVYPGSGLGCDDDLGPWVQVAAHRGIIDGYDQNAITKADAARLIVLSHYTLNGLDTGNGVIAPDDVTPEIVHAHVLKVVDDYRRGSRDPWKFEYHFKDTTDAPPRLASYVAFMGIRGWSTGDEIAKTFSPNSYPEKAALARLALKARGFGDLQMENIAKMRLATAGRPYFVDKDTAPYKRYAEASESMRHFDAAHGIPSPGPCSTMAPLGGAPSSERTAACRMLKPLAAGLAPISTSAGLMNQMLILGMNGQIGNAVLGLEVVYDLYHFQRAVFSTPAINLTPGIGLNAYIGKSSSRVHTGVISTWSGIAFSGSGSVKIPFFKIAPTIGGGTSADGNTAVVQAGWQANINVPGILPQIRNLPRPPVGAAAAVPWDTATAFLEQTTWVAFTRMGGAGSRYTQFSGETYTRQAANLVLDMVARAPWAAVIAGPETLARGVMRDLNIDVASCP